MKFLDFFRRNKKRNRTPFSINQMNDKEKIARLDDLILFNAELQHSMILDAFQLEEKRTDQIKKFYV